MRARQSGDVDGNEIAGPVKGEMRPLKAAA
jgi:hypothetical protein